MPRARGDSKQIEDAARLPYCWGLRVRGIFPPAPSERGEWVPTGAVLHLIGATHDVLANFAYDPRSKGRRELVIAPGVWPRWRAWPSKPPLPKQRH